MPGRRHRPRTSIFPLAAGVVMIAYGLYLALTWSGAESVRWKAGLVLVGCGVFLMLVFALELAIDRRRAGSRHS